MPMTLVKGTKHALLLTYASFLVVNGLPTPRGLLDSVLELGSIFRPAPSPAIAAAASSSGASNAITVTPTDVTFVVEEVEPPMLTQYPNRGSRVVYMGGQEGDLPMPTLPPFGASPFDLSASFLGDRDPLGITRGMSEAQPAYSETKGNGSRPVTTPGISQGPQNCEETGLSTGVSETVIASYYADWAAKQLAPEDVDFTRFNWVYFAFAVPNQDFDLVFTQNDSEELLHRLVAAAHEQGRNVKLSVGGWTGSTHFSRAVRNSAGRSKLCRSIVSAYSRFHLDGIDIDWEYPYSTGAGNENSPDDSANFLKLLKLLREELPADARITVAGPLWPFAGEDGEPMRDMTEFADVLDWILIMNYDVWGSSPTPGPNAPLADGCGNSTQPLANAEAAIRSWTEAGVPASQLVLGIPAYGYVSRSCAERLATRSDSTVELKGDDGGTEGGPIQFRELVRQGALIRNNGGGTEEYDDAGGFERRWDKCSSTPWLRSETVRQVVSYDDPESIRLKAEMGRHAGIRGVNMFAAHGDDGWALVDGARRGLGVLV